MHLWDPPFCGDIDLRITKDGTWVHEGTPIRRQAMVKLFASVLKRENDTDYFLVTPVEKVGIQVEDCPFFVAEMDVSGAGQDQILRFKTTTEETVEAGLDHKLMMGTAKDGEPHPTLHIRSSLNGLINRAVFYRLVEMASEKIIDGTPKLGVWSNGVFFEFD